MLTSGGNSLVRTISSSRISCERSFFQMSIGIKNPLPNFGGPVLHTLHHTAHILYRVWRGLKALPRPLATLCNNQRSLFHCAFSIMFSHTRQTFLAPIPYGTTTFLIDSIDGIRTFLLYPLMDSRSCT